MIASFVAHSLKTLLDMDVNASQLRARHKQDAENYVYVCLLSGTRLYHIDGFPDQLERLQKLHEELGHHSIIVAPEWPYAPRGQLWILERIE